MADFERRWQTWGDGGRLSRTVADLGRRWQTWGDGGRLSKTAADLELSWQTWDSCGGLCSMVCNFRAGLYGSPEDCKLMNKVGDFNRRLPTGEMEMSQFAQLCHQLNAFCGYTFFDAECAKSALL